MDRDVALDRGRLDPGADDGQWLASALLQTTPGSALQRQPATESPGVAFWFTVRLTEPLDSDQLLLEFIRQYHHLGSASEAEAYRVERAWHWVGTPKTASAEDVTKGYILLHVNDRSLRPTSAGEKRERRAYFAKLAESERASINEEADRQFWRKTNYKVGQKLGYSADDKKMAVYWIELRDELIRQHEAIRQLPAPVRDFLFTADAPRTLEPKDYATVLRMAEKLAVLSPAELDDYKSKVNAETTEWLEFESSVDRYLSARKARREAMIEREVVRSKLYGLAALYRKWRDYRAAVQAVRNTPSRDEFGVRDPTKQIFQDQADALRDELTAELAAHGFASIGAFEEMIESYERAFAKETVAIAMDLLAKYEHVLYEEEKKYQNPAHAASLYERLGQTQAKAKYQEAKEKRSSADMIRPDPDLHRYMPGELQMKRELRAEASTAESTAEAAVLGLSDDHPLPRNKDFDRQALARAGAGDVQSLMLGYIRDRRKDIAKTRANLDDDNDLIYKLDDLMKASYELQGIAPDSIFDLIVRDRAKEVASRDALIKFLVGVFAVIFSILTLGTGTLAAIAGVAAFGLSAYIALEEFREYEIKSAAHGAQLLSDEPSLTWVIVAVIGAGIDLAAAATAIRAMKPAIETFNATSDIAQLEKSLKALGEVNDQLRVNVLRAAEAELQYHKALKNLVTTGGRLNMAILPGAEEFGKLVVVAYHLAKRGVIKFEAFLLHLKANKLIAEIDTLTPGELKILREAFAEGLTKSEFGLVKYADLSEQIRGVYSAAQVEEIAAHGKSLGYTDQQVIDILEMGSIAKPGKKPPKVPLTTDQLKTQMDNFATVIKPRGFPYRFESLEQFNRFKSELDGLLGKYGVPKGDVVLQGSALRTPAAKDVDVAIFLSDSQFAAYAKQCREGLLARVSERARDKLVAGLDEQIKQGYISKFYFDKVDASTSFGQEAHTLLETPFGVETDISVMLSSSKLALFPSMKL